MQPLAFILSRMRFAVRPGMPVSFLLQKLTYAPYPQRSRLSSSRLALCFFLLAIAQCAGHLVLHSFAIADDVSTTLAATKLTEQRVRVVEPGLPIIRGNVMYICGGIPGAGDESCLKVADCDANMTDVSAVSNGPRCVHNVG
jgi:hypothetical protein